jgi:hypothetical protein
LAVSWWSCTGAFIAAPNEGAVADALETLSKIFVDLEMMDGGTQISAGQRREGSDITEGMSI